MINATQFLDRRDLLVDYAILDRFWLPRPAKVRILVVVEPEVSPGPPSSGFGLGRAVSYLRNETFGFVGFEVHFAQRGKENDPAAVVINAAPGPWGHHYTKFRFHSVDTEGKPIIHRYDQVWCFGFNPPVHDGGINAQVSSSDYSPSNAEVEVLSTWMDAGGGVLAMGDHNFIGSAMCWRLPRVGTMRAWLKHSNDGKSVPNRSGPDRHDTNRPQNASQDPLVVTNPAMIPSSAAERDTVTQPLVWKRYVVPSLFPWAVRRRPHPILCGGSLGVIDRFPDHPHEGLVVHESLIDMAANCAHDASKDEYPTVNGVQPRPEVIAWVDTLGDPPYFHQKGDQPARRFPAISVYDGHSISHGRVVVDSTWHHWFDVNIADLEEADTTAFRKIKRYFQNVAIYLARKHQQAQMLNYATFWSIMSVSAFEELTLDQPILVLGGLAIDILGRKTSECLVTTWLLDKMPIPILQALPKLPRPSPCWSCPPDDLFIHAVMGGIVRELLPFRDELLATAWGDGGASERSPSVEQVEAAIAKGTLVGLEVALKLVEENRESLDAATRVVNEGVEHARKRLERGLAAGAR